MLRRSTFLCLALGLRLAAQTEAPAKTLHVLFIGNSYTFYNNLPKLLESIAGSQKAGPRIEAEVSVSGGKTLQWHWENKRAVEAIRKGGWDFVVLQEHSTLGRIAPAGGMPEINHPAAYFDFAARFNGEITQAGARTVLYATWARDGFPEQQRRLDDAITRLAEKLDATIVPAGLAWTVTRLEAPSIKLHMPDRSHPTMAGSYLNALLFYQCLTGRKAVDPPAAIAGPKSPGDPRQVTLADLPWSDATALNQFAQRVAAQEPRCPAR
jgi:hypothetical protein